VRSCKGQSGLPSSLQDLQGRCGWAGRQTGKQRDRQADRQTDRQPDRHHENPEAARPEALAAGNATQQVAGWFSGLASRVRAAIGVQLRERCRAEGGQRMQDDILVLDCHLATSRGVWFERKLTSIVRRPREANVEGRRKQQHLKSPTPKAAMVGALVNSRSAGKQLQTQRAAQRSFLPASAVRVQIVREVTQFPETQALSPLDRISRLDFPFASPSCHLASVGSPLFPPTCHSRRCAVQ
jgi:hypothetical protein